VGRLIEGPRDAPPRLPPPPRAPPPPPPLPPRDQASLATIATLRMAIATVRNRCIAFLLLTVSVPCQRRASETPEQ
jgi:hypothetical protein